MDSPHKGSVEMAHWQPASWWYHGIETLSVLLAICGGNPLITGGFPSQRVSRNGSLATCLMMVSWHWNTFRIIGHLWRESTGNCNKGPVMWIFDNFFVVSTIMWSFWLFKSQQTCPQSVGICNIISCSISIKLYLFEISQNEQWMNYNRVLIKFISLR